MMLVAFPVSRKISNLRRECAINELQHTAGIVENRLSAMATTLNRQLGALGNTVARDYDFSMKLLVENNATAPEVYEMASRYMEPMGLSVLAIIDANNRVVSSGHFPAEAGNPADKVLANIDGAGRFVTENIGGRELLTFQSRASFTCSNVAMFVVGGYIIDSLFLTGFQLRDHVTLLLKRGNSVVGMNDIQTMSALKDNMIIINDRSWLAAEVPLKARGATELPELLLLMPEPAKLNPWSIF
jgi:hypothetical protein